MPDPSIEMDLDVLDLEFNVVSSLSLFDCARDFYHWIFLTLKEGISTKF